VAAVISFSPQGKRTDFTQSCAAVSLVLLNGAGGTTCFGQTRVHSPTKVQPQMGVVLGENGGSGLWRPDRENQIVALGEPRWLRAGEERVQP